MVIDMARIANRRAPREACGFILEDGAVIEVRNIASENHHFHMNPDDQMQWWYNAIAIWHSHPGGDVQPSQIDLDMQRIAYDQRTMVIVNLTGDVSVTACP